MGQITHGEHHDPQSRRRCEDAAAPPRRGHGRSMEQEARLILADAVSREAVPESGLGTAIHELFKPFGGVELELLPREPMR